MSEDPEDDGRDPAASTPGDPLSALADSVGERRDRSDEDDLDGLFGEQDFDEVDAGSLWESGADAGESEFGAVGEVIEEGEKTYVVSKRNFCERCRYFSEPPAVRCTHGGTEIREFADMNYVRVYSCPIVEERGLVDEHRAE